MHPCMHAQFETQCRYWHSNNCNTVAALLLQVGYDSYFHEGKSTRIFGPCYICVGFLYKGINLIVYNIFAILIGVPMVFVWAILNALMMMLYVWIFQPIIKNVILCTYIWCPLCTICFTALCTPIVDMFARCLRQIRVKVNLESESGTKIEEEKMTEVIQLLYCEQYLILFELNNVGIVVVFNPTISCIL